MRWVFNFVTLHEIANTLTAHPKNDPSELTAIGQLKLVSVIMWLFDKMMAVLNNKYRSEYSKPFTKEVVGAVVALVWPISLTLLLVFSCASLGARRGRGAISGNAVISTE